MFVSLKPKGFSARYNAPMEAIFQLPPRLRPRHAAAGLLAFTVSCLAQSPVHGRKYKPPPPTAHIVITVEKGFNGKPIPNAAVVFHSTKEGKDNGNLELKTDPDGRATLDLIEIGSHVTVQVIATGFATHAEEFDVPGDSKEILVKMLRPRAQVSTYQDNDGKAADVKPGVQEHIKPAPATPPQNSPTAPLRTAPVANTPANTAVPKPSTSPGPQQ